MDDEAVDEKRAAPIVGLAVKTLQNKRCTGGGPPFFKTSPSKRGGVRYRVSDLLAWRADRVVGSTSETGHG